jgi:hypothetical protein
MSRFACLAFFGFQIAANSSSVVRKVNSYEGDFSESYEEDQTDSIHCVVWGDWAFQGKNFRSKEDAQAYFKQIKRTELAAIQYHGAHVVNRFMSKRLTRVDWSKMKHWCREHHKIEAISPSSAVDEEAPSPWNRAEARVPPSSLAEEQEAPKPRNRAEARVRHNGAVSHGRNRGHIHGTVSHSHSSEDALDRESSLFETSFVAARAPRRSRFHPVTASLASGGMEALDKKASTLSGKVALLEGEATSLAAKASALLKSIGADDTTSNGASSLLELEPESHHGVKLKSRLAALEEYTAAVMDKTNLLEVELFGASTAEKAGSSHKQGAHSSFKMQIKKVAARIDELKSRLSTMESTPLLGEVAKLEDTTACLGAEAAQIFTSIGVESVKAPEKPNIAHEALKDRLGSLEGYAEDLQRNAASLEYEIVGSKPTAVSSSSRSASCIKDHAVSLGDQLTDLKNRLSVLTSSTIVTDVGRMEDAVTSLSSRAASLSKNVGISDSLTQDSSLAPQDAPLKSRIASLEAYIGNMQTTTAALEEQLAGNVGKHPAPSQKDTLKSKAKFLELQIENMNSRISSLEQQV